MGGYIAREKVEYPDQGYFTIPDYRPTPDDYIDESGEEPEPVKIPANFEVCGTCRGTGSMVDPSIDSNGITGSEMEELGDDFRESYFRGDYDITCSECKGRRVVLEARRDILDETQKEVLEAYEIALAEEGYEIGMRNRGIQF